MASVRNIGEWKLGIVKNNVVPLVMAIFIMQYPLRGGDTLDLGFLPTAVAILMVGLSFFIRTRRAAFLSLFDAVVLTYFVLIFVSIMIAGLDEMAFRYFIQITALSIFPYWVIRSFGFSLDDAKRFVGLFPYVAIMAAACMMCIVGPTDLIAYAGFRLGNEKLNPVGVGFAFGISAFISFISVRMTLCNYFIGAISIMVSSLIVVLTGSRASMLALASIMGVYFIARRAVDWKTIIILLVMFGVLYCAYGFLDEGMVDDRFINALESESAQARYSSWTQALLMFYDQPLYGHGLGQFELKNGEYVHNIILEHMANGGLILTAPLFLLIVYILRMTIANIKWCSSEFILLFTLLSVYAILVRFFSLSMANTKEIFIFIAMAISCRQSMISSKYKIAENSAHYKSIG